MAGNVNNFQFGNRNVQGGQGNITGHEHQITQSFGSTRVEGLREVVAVATELLDSLALADRPPLEAAIQELQSVPPGNEGQVRNILDRVNDRANRLTEKYSGALRLAELASQTAGLWMGPG